MKKFETPFILVIDWHSAGQLPQPFEHEHKNNVIVLEDGAELRQLEQLGLGMTKYVIHTERFPAGGQVDLEKFIEVFRRAYKLDSTDIRQTIRWALKGSIAPSSVV